MKYKKLLYINKILCIVLAVLLIIAAIPFSNVFAENGVAETSDNHESDYIEESQSSDESTILPENSGESDTETPDLTGNASTGESDTETPDLTGNASTGESDTETPDLAGNASTEENSGEDANTDEGESAGESEDATDDQEEMTKHSRVDLSAGNDHINTSLGGNTIASGDDAKLVVMEADGDDNSGYYNAYVASEAGLRSALWDLYQANTPQTSYIMYFGANISLSTSSATMFNNTTTATSSSDVTFASLSGRVDTLVWTGMKADEITYSPATSAPTTATVFSTHTGNKFFGCNIILRNISYNFKTGSGGTGNAVFMNGYNLTLGGNSWQTAGIQFFGGSDSGTVTPADGTATMTVYSTGTGASYFFGGMQTGTLDGNAEININNTSGNAVTVYGGGYGTSALNPAHVTGNVTTTITGMSTTAGGLYTYVGGVYYGNIGGRITNTISGDGRFSQSSPDYTYKIGNYIGGSYNGDVGSDSTLGGDVDTSDLGFDYSSLTGTYDYIIKNDIDTSLYSSGRMYYIGINFTAGIVKGNIINVIKAGSTGAGSFTGLICGAGASAAISGSWNGTFSVSSTNGTVGNVSAGTAAAKSNASFQLYGNITNVIRAGSISTVSADHYWFRGAGWGYVEGNAYSEIGTDGIVYASDKNIYSYSTTTNNLAYQTGFDMVGGGGSASSVGNDFCIVGDTTLVLREVLARWAYGGNFGGVHIGHSKIQLHKGIVDTCEGSGFYARIHVGDSRAEVYGGQVDWFLSGGGWNDINQDGNVSVEVFDRPDIYINASIGGTYGSTTNHYISGDSEIIVHGGNFSGSARSQPYSGFSAGPSYYGTIYGNATVTLDLRGNQNGFQIAQGDYISGGRRYNTNILVYSYLGIDSSNTITLNIMTDDGSVDLLNGINIYGDCSYNNSNTYNYTRSGQITININAPGANLGNLFATSYPNLSSGALIRDVTINLVSADTIQSLSGGNGTETITNAIAATSELQNKYSVINVGPQSSTPGDILYDNQQDMTDDGLPHTTKVTGGGKGIVTFTSMEIRKRLLIAEDGDIKNGGTVVTATNHATDYNKFGDVKIYAGEGVEAAGIGVMQSDKVFIAGKLTVEGEGTAYIQSLGVKDQVVFTDADVNSNTVTWLKVGSTAAATNLQTNWFGATQGWFVFTLNPSGLTNAQKLTPENLRGREADTGKFFIGDNDTHLSTTDGYAVAIAASVYEWEVTEGEGMVSHNVPVSTSKPSSGYISAYGTVAADTPSKQGMIAVPSEKIPSPIDYPEFSFIPDSVLGEWVKGLQIHRSDEYITAPQHQNCAEYGEQSIGDYNQSATMVWAAAGEDKNYSFDLKVQYTNDVQLTARSVLIHEAEAATISGAADIIAYNQAQGRPFFTTSITDALVSEVQQPLAEGEYMRVHQITYTAGQVPGSGNEEALTVNLIVVKEDTMLATDRSYGLYARDAVMPLATAQALSGQAELDSDHTHAVAILADGITDTPTIDSEAIGKITSTTESEIPKEVPVTYTYTPSEGAETLTKPVRVVIGQGSLDFTFYKTNPDGEALENVVFTLYRWDIASSNWLMEDGLTALSLHDGEVTFTELASGDYLLEETQTLPGYELPRGRWKITLDVGSNIITITTLDGSPPAFAYENGVYTLINYKLNELPFTGNNDALLMAIIGTLLLNGSGILMIIYKKKKKNTSGGL